MMSPSRPQVSVIVPVYNAVPYLRQSLESVLSQVGIDIELIVVDDGSDDGSQEIAKSYPSIRLIKQDRQGACIARNVGLRNATAEYVKFLDADDYLEPDIIKKQFELSKVSCENSIIYCDTVFFNDDTGDRRIVSLELDCRGDQVVQLFKANIPTPAPLHRRKLLLQIGGFDGRLARAQEYNLHIRLAMAGCNFVRLPVIGTNAREHSASHRITNQRNDQLGEENAVLRRQVYVDLLHKHYGNVIPRSLRQYFASNAVENALIELRRGNIECARRALVRMSIIELTFLDLIIGVAKTFGRAAWFKIAQLNNFLLENSKRRDRRS